MKANPEDTRVMTHQFLHRLSLCHSRGFHAESLMGPPGVVTADPFSDETHGVLLGFEVMMHSLLFNFRITRSIIPLCRAQCRVMNSCRSP